MSEQEKNTGGNTAGSSIVVTKQANNRNKTPYRPNELEEVTDVHHKRSTAPAVPSATELKDVPDATTTITTINKKTNRQDRKECDQALVSGKHKNSFPKKLPSSTNSNRRDISPESIPLELIESGSQKTVQPQAIPLQVDSIESAIDVEALEKDSVDRGEEDSFIDEVKMLQIPQVAKEHSEWSDDEEASGLPRSESRSSRISRVVRQFFCCGVSYEAPSEENVATERRDHRQGI